MARSLNRAQLIGNLTRDPELRYTPNGTAVCSFGLATNRSWKTDTGEKREEAEFHNIVAWNKLAELCSQFLVKGRKVFVEGRLATRSWNAQDGTQKTRTEIVISDMILLDSKRPEGSSVTPEPEAKEEQKEVVTKADKKETSKKSQGTSEKSQAEGTEKSQGTTEKPDEKPKKTEEASSDEVVPDDIPF
jgi:single-strand DNA-binding protein